MSDANGHFFSKGKMSFVVFDQNAKQINADMGRIFEVDYTVTNPLQADSITTQIVFYQGIVADSTITEIPFNYVNGSTKIYPNPFVDVEETIVELPAKFEVFQNYPNPFNPATTIQFTLPVASNVTLKIFNVLGQQVEVLLDRKYYETGSHKEIFQSTKLASGMYFYQITARPTDKSKREFIKTSKMIYLK